MKSQDGNDERGRKQTGPGESRQERLAEALRENLRRRKAQQRGRSPSDGAQPRRLPSDKGE